MSENKKRVSGLIKGLLGLAVASSPNLSAQDDTEEVFELSPFNVDASQDTGYRANSTLAGTRLNTELKDVAASVTVVTEDFMNDIGATDLEGILAFTGSTEMTGIEGNYHGAENDEGSNDMGTTRPDARPTSRVRGLAAADMTQDYFLTEAPIDSFNMDQVTINRGPNSALFGLGSAGGVMNASLKKAQFRNFVKIQTKHDSFGTQRYVLDVNRQLVEDKLAIRFAALDSDRGYEQRNAQNLDSRQYGTITFNPLKNTTFRANYTNGKIFASKPNTATPKDKSSTWAALGKPLWDPVTSRFYANKAAFSSMMGAGETAEAIDTYAISNETTDPWFDYDLFGEQKLASGYKYHSIMFADPNSPLPGGFGTPEFLKVGIRDKKKNAFYPNSAKRHGMIEWNQNSNFFEDPIGSSPYARGLDPILANYYRTPYIQDRNIFDYRTTSLQGPNRMHDAEFDSFSATLEQTFLEDKLGISFAIYEEEHKDDYMSFKGDIMPDTNLRYINGEMNPNVGRAYNGGNEYAEPFTDIQEAKRVTAFAEYDFADRGNDGWVSKLGKHVFTALAGSQETDALVRTHKGTFLDPSIQEYMYGADNASLSRYKIPRVYRVSYLNGSLLDAEGLAAGLTGLEVRQLPPVHASDVLTWSAEKAAGYTAEELEADYTLGFDHMSGIKVNNYTREPGLVQHASATRTLSVVDSLSTVLQSYFFNGNLVAAGSWRKDTIELSRGDLEDQKDPDTDIFPYVLPTFDEFTDLGDITATSYSLVAHTPAFINDKLPWNSELSFHYVNSNNADARGGDKDVFGRSLNLSTGVTEEYGMSLRTMEGRLHLKLNFYDSSEQNSVLKDVGGLYKIEADILANNTPAELAAAGYDVAPVQGMLDLFGLKPDGGEPNLVNWMGGVIELDSWSGASNPGHVQQKSSGNTASKGTELELTYNPTHNWRISFNYSKVEAIKSDLVGPENEYIDLRMSTWTSAAGGDLFLNETREDEDGTIRYDDRVMVPVDAANPNGPKVLNSDILSKLGEVYTATALDGFPVPELRQHRANIVTNYTFGGDSPSFMQGFSVGGAVRWEGKMAAGYAFKPDDDLGWTQDLDNIYYSPAETSVDLWLGFRHKFEKAGVDWRARLGAKNITSDEGLLDTKYNPDGTRGSFRIEPGKRYELSNNFSF